MKKYPLIKIEWIDAYACVEEHPIRRFIQTTVGFKVEDTKDYIRLCQNISDGEPNPPFMHIVKTTIVHTKKYNV